MFECMTEQSVDVPVPLSCGNMDEVIQLTPRERMSVCTSSQIVHVPSPQCHEDIAAMIAVRSVGVAMIPTGAVKKWFKGKGLRVLSSLTMGVTTCSSIVNSSLRQGRHREDTVSCDAEYDDHRGNTGFQVHSNIHWCRWHA